MQAHTTIIRRPRRHDAVGAALRGAYGRDACLPDEMERLLDVLDGLGKRNGD